MAVVSTEWRFRPTLLGRRMLFFYCGECGARNRETKVFLVRAEEYVHPLLESMCLGCHANNAFYNPDQHAWLTAR